MFSQFTFTTPICTVRQTEEILMLRMDPVKEKEMVFGWMWSLVLLLRYLCKCQCHACDRLQAALSASIQSENPYIQSEILKKCILVDLLLVDLLQLSVEQQMQKLWLSELYHLEILQVYNCICPLEVDLIFRHTILLYHVFYYQDCFLEGDSLRKFKNMHNCINFL